MLIHVNEVLELREVCRAFDKVPDVPIAGTSAVSMFNEKLQADPYFGRSFCLARDGRFLQVLPLDARAFEESPGGLGRPSTYADQGFWPTSGQPDG